MASRKGGSDRMKLLAMVSRGQAQSIAGRPIELKQLEDDADDDDADDQV